jgi:hypothetical protein
MHPENDPAVPSDDAWSWTKVVVYLFLGTAFVTALSRAIVWLQTGEWNTGLCVYQGPAPSYMRPNAYCERHMTGWLKVDEFISWFTRDVDVSMIPIYLAMLILALRFVWVLRFPKQTEAVGDK